jgi:hypothetical protein
MFRLCCRGPSLSLRVPRPPRLPALRRVSLDAAARIAALEARANADPRDVATQLPLLSALVATRTRQGYDTVIDRWEHTAEHVSPLLSCAVSPTVSAEPRLPPPPLRRRL